MSGRRQSGERATTPALGSIQAVCIDLDGTLLDTIPDLAEAANRMLARLGLARLDQALLETFVGKGADVLIERALAAAGRAEVRRGVPAFDEARQVFFACYRQTNGEAARPYDGVAEGLERLHACGLRLACVTNKPGEFVAPLLERFGLARWFAFAIAGDTLPVRKPDPGQLLEACRRWSLAPHQVLLVGDSMNDAAAARACAMPVLLVPYGYNEGEPVERVDADGIVGTLCELAALFERNK